MTNIDFDGAAERARKRLEDSGVIAGKSVGADASGPSTNSAEASPAGPFDLMARENQEVANVGQRRDKKSQKGEEKKVFTAHDLNNEIEDSLNEFNMGSNPDFAYLNGEQQLKVVRDLKKRIVDIVKSDAQTQYSETVKSGVANLIKKSFTKESGVKDMERTVFKALKETEEGRQLIQREFDLLSKRQREEKKDVTVHNDGSIITKYLSALEVPSVTPSEIEAIHNFNTVATAFSQMPYEWGQDKSGKNKKEYERVKAEYAKSLDEITKIKESRDTSPNKDESMLSMAVLHNSIYREQLLNTHPEFEAFLVEFSEDKKLTGDLKENAKGFLKKIVGTKGVNAMITAGGAVTRWATVSTLGMVGAPIVGGVIGAIRKRFQAKETLTERQKEGRRGAKDETKEKSRMVDVTLLINGLKKMSEKVQNATDENEKSKLLAKLRVVVSHTQEQIEKGQVNLGDAKNILSNQVNLVTNLNQAYVLTNSSEVNEDLQELIENSIRKFEEGYKRADKDGNRRFVLGKDTKIEQAQKAFIIKQMKQGAIIGVGFATLGYTARYVGEHLGWWGHAGTQATTSTPETPKADAGERFVDRAYNWLNKFKFWGNEKTPTAASGAATSLSNPTFTPPSSTAEFTNGHMSGGPGVSGSQVYEGGKGGGPGPVGSGREVPTDNHVAGNKTPVVRPETNSPTTLAQINTVRIAGLNPPESLPVSTEINPNIPGIKSYPLGEAPSAQAVAEARAAVLAKIDAIKVPGVTFDNGKGGIQGVIDLRKQYFDALKGNYDSLPQSVQEFMKEPNATKLAMKLGLFDPESADGKESAMILKGAILKFDNEGNLVFGTPDADGKIPVLEKYDGTMFDSDGSGKAGAKIGNSGTETSPEPKPLPYKTAEEARSDIFKKLSFPKPEIDGGEMPSSEISAPRYVPDFAQETPEEAPRYAPTREMPEEATRPTSQRGIPESTTAGRVNAYGSDQDRWNTPEDMARLRAADMHRASAGYSPYGSSGGGWGSYFGGQSEIERVEFNHMSQELGLPSEFNRNYFQLSDEAMTNVRDIHRENVDNIFGRSVQWGMIKDKDVGPFIKGDTKVIGENPQLVSLNRYLVKLQEATGLKSKGGLFRKGEKVGEYIARALQKAEREGYLGSLNLRYNGTK